MASHAEFSPSRLPMLAQCPCFLGGPAGPAAARGTEIHALIEDSINGKAPVIPDSHADQVAFALAVLDDAKALIGDDAQVYSELPLKTPLPGCEGTSDLVIVDTFKAEGVVADFKSGWGERGDAGGHLQMLCYAIGAVKRFHLEVVHVWLVEVDKRKVSRATLTDDELLGPRLKTIADVIRKAQTATDADAVANPACKWCVKAVTCPAVVSGAIVPATTNLPANPKEAVHALAVSDLAAFLDRYSEKVELAAEILAAAKARAFAIIEAGGEVPGYELVNGRKTRRWTEEACAEMALRKEAEAASVDVADLYTAEFKTPAQIEKLAPALKAAVKNLVTTTTHPKLARVENAKAEENAA